ncbi:hypothetical protein GCM10022205_57000 [Spinactinospora alkalitolerans]
MPSASARSISAPVQPAADREKTAEKIDTCAPAPLPGQAGPTPFGLTVLQRAPTVRPPSLGAYPIASNARWKDCGNPSRSEMLASTSSG